MLERLLHARRVTRVERTELKARGEGRLGRRFGALRGLLRTFSGKRRNLIGAEQSDRLRVELLLHQLRLVRCTTGAKIDPGEKPEISEQQQDRYGFHDFPWVLTESCAIRTRPSSTRLSTSRTGTDRKSTRLNSSHLVISYAVFCLKKKKKHIKTTKTHNTRTNTEQHCIEQWRWTD